jgi:hypothetical protein
MNDTQTTTRPQSRTGPARRNLPPDLLTLRSPECPRWLRRDTAAALAGVSRRTIDRWRGATRRDGTPVLRTRQFVDDVTRCPVLVSRDDLLILADVPADDDAVIARIERASPSAA